MGLEIVFIIIILLIVLIGAIAIAYDNYKTKKTWGENHKGTKLPKSFK